MKKKHYLHLAIFAACLMFGFVIYSGTKGSTELRSSASATACEISITIPTSTPTPSITTTSTKPSRPPVSAKPSRPPVPTPIICKNKTDIALVFDRSTTMNSLESDGRKKIEWAKEAAQGFVDAIQATKNKNVRLSVSHFGRQGNDGLGIHTADNNSILELGLSSDYALVKEAISRVNFINSGTCIVCGIRLGNQSLFSSTNTKYQVLLSDGIANKNWDGTSGGAAGNPITNAITEANSGRISGINYYVLGYGKKPNDINETTLKSIAGPEANYSYKPEVADWSTAFIDILGKICN